MLYGGAAIQLTSGTSGITIESEPVRGDLSLLRYNMVVQKITIGPEMYRILKVLHTEEVFSYRQQIARQHSCQKNFGQGRKCSRPCKDFPSSSLIIMQTLVAVCNSTWAYMRGSKIFGAMGPSPLPLNMNRA